MTTATMSAPISMTPAAARRIAEIVAGDPDNRFLRISVEGGGCSGFQYKFELAQGPEPGDQVVERDGSGILVDAVSMEYLAGSEVDFVDDLIGASFRIRNPQAQSSCGCGTSFSL